MFWGWFCCFVLNVIGLFHQTFQRQGNVGAISLEYQITQNSVSCLLMASKQSVASVQCLFSLALTQQLLLSLRFIFLSLFKPFSSLLSFLFSFNILLPVINHFSSCPFPSCHVPLSLKLSILILGIFPLALSMFSTYWSAFAYFTIKIRK